MLLKASNHIGTLFKTTLDLPEISFLFLQRSVSLSKILLSCIERLEDSVQVTLCRVILLEVTFHVTGPRQPIPKLALTHQPLTNRIKFLHYFSQLLEVGRDLVVGIPLACGDRRWSLIEQPV